MEELSEKEEYKETLSKEEISRIKDCDLREIRHKYWLKKNKAFRDEYNIPCSELDEVSDQIRNEERKEIEKYRIKKGIPEPLKW